MSGECSKSQKSCATRMQSIVQRADAIQQWERERRDDPERDALLRQLQDQVNDLTLFLEEERFKHSETRRTNAEEMQETMRSMTQLREEETQKIAEASSAELQQQKDEFETRIAEMKKEHEKQDAKRARELQYLQGAFESYKSQVLMEMNEKWKEKVDDMHREYDDKFDEKVTELRKKVAQERSAEFARMEKNARAEILSLNRDHKREVEALQRKFASHRDDIEKLQSTEKELTDLLSQHERLQGDYSDASQKLVQVSRDLADTKLQLLGFEERFSDKVSEIDDKYQDQLQELLRNNIELRQLYVRKCKELNDEKDISEDVFYENLEQAKSTIRRKIFAHLFQDTWELALYLEAQAKLNFDPVTPKPSTQVPDPNDPSHPDHPDYRGAGQDGDADGTSPIDPADDPNLPTYLKPHKRSPYHEKCFEPKVPCGN